MSVARFVCPHCEKPAEVQVTGVTRSRPCPHCEEVVMLQVVSREKTKGAKRRMALLVGAEIENAPPVRERALASSSRQSSDVDDSSAPQPEPLLETFSEVQPLEREKRLSFKALQPMVEGPGYESRVVEGTVPEILKHDPEVQAMKMRLILGSVLVVLAVCLVVAWNVVEKQLESHTLADKSAKAADMRLKARMQRDNSIGLRKQDADGASLAQDQAGQLTFEHAQKNDAVDTTEDDDKSSKPEPIRIPLSLGQTISSQANGELASGILGQQ